MDSLVLVAQFLTDPSNLMIIAVGTLVGLIVGALPGLGSVVLIALMLPFVVRMDPTTGIALCAIVYCATTYGGSLTAILINTPGTPAAAMTTFDGFPLAQKGQAGRALGIATFSSAIGGILGILVMIVATPLLAKLAYQFGPAEFFALAVFGMSMLASISGASMIKNFIGGAFGLLLATIGTDLTTGVERFTFGQPDLYEGIAVVQIMIGIFAGGELLRQATQTKVKRELIAEGVTRLPSWQDFRRIWKTVLRSTGIGTVIGILPAEGGKVAAMIAYNEEYRWSKNKDEFGKGAIEGIAAPEAANNAATGGTMVPTLALGIPGGGSTAIILTAMLILGLRPGPQLFVEQPDLLAGIFGAMLGANVCFLIYGLLGAKLFSRITLIPTTILWPCVIALACLGAYSLQQSMFDIGVMIFFAVLGFFLNRHGYAPAPIIMGLILGELIETSLKQSYLIYDGNLLAILGQPIALAFLLLSLLGICGPLIAKALGAFRDKQASLLTGNDE
ncbi:tripartite tricarboxylate transporter permease [Paracoccus sp. Z330]|uniref:Tripartite tricarboxylate transporter permease n=1 Tax=Paracoccus onchidii TaxID=3017813 RepID=A0ABT4ZGN4_9RHOB|nr:tripartite tricarboxylate transporter permease [Paracoccus onchidii]MDB6178429.1 tripartite tricarboxylate transporter permease [Paracoccus onchidii]